MGRERTSSDYIELTIATSDACKSECEKTPITKIHIDYICENTLYSTYNVKNVESCYNWVK